MFASLQLDQVELTPPGGFTAEAAKVKKTSIIFSFFFAYKI